MFQWHKEINRLDFPAAQVYHLERSLSAVQVALPGLPSQEATAYLCVFSADKGLRVALVLHLHTSRRLAFYLREGGDVPQREADRLIDEGITFAESLGFMLSNVDFRKRSTQQRSSLWDSLPLKNGIEPVASATVDALVPGAKALSATTFPPSPEQPAAGGNPLPLPFFPSPAADEAVVELSEETFPDPQLPVKELDEEGQEVSLLPSAPAETTSALADEVLPPAPTLIEESGAPTISDPCKAPDSADRLPPVMPVRAPAMRTRALKRLPGAEEVTARRQKLLESLGRFLASL